jgi:hypothetical protein
MYLRKRHLFLTGIVTSLALQLQLQQVIFCSTGQAFSGVSLENPIRNYAFTATLPLLKSRSLNLISLMQDISYVVVFKIMLALGINVE